MERHDNDVAFIYEQPSAWGSSLKSTKYTA